MNDLLELVDMLSKIGHEKGIEDSEFKQVLGMLYLQGREILITNQSNAKGLHKGGDEPLFPITPDPENL